MISTWFCLFCLSVLSASAASQHVVKVGPPMTQTIRLSVTNVNEAKGTIWVGIYEGDEDFLDRDKARLVSVKVDEQGIAYLDLPDMVIGKEYALGIFHDLDDDGNLNTNWFGLPSEPWGFTGKIKTRLRLPTFSEVKFRVTAQELFTSIKLRMI